MCIGTNYEGDRKICFCYSRQIKGCNDLEMKIATNEERKNYKDYLGMFW